MIWVFSQRTSETKPSQAKESLQFHGRLGRVLSGGWEVSGRETTTWLPSGNSTYIAIEHGAVEIVK